MALFEEWPICMCDPHLNDDIAFPVKFISFRPFFFFFGLQFCTILILLKKKKLLLELIFKFSQIENEYGNMESSYGQQGKDYVKWAASMALGLGAGVPWVMCKQTDAPENIVKSLP